MRNRASANKSREKKRAEQHQLSEKIDSLTNQVTEMQSRIVHLEAENRMYKEQVSFLKVCKTRKKIFFVLFLFII